MGWVITSPSAHSSYVPYRNHTWRDWRNGSIHKNQSVSSIYCTSKFLSIVSSTCEHIVNHRDLCCSSQAPVLCCSSVCLSHYSVVDCLFLILFFSTSHLLEDKPVHLAIQKAKSFRSKHLCLLTATYQAS